MGKKIKFLKYIIPIIFAVIITIIYGFTVGGDFKFLFGFILFSAVVCLFLFLIRNDAFLKPPNKLLKAFLTSTVALILSIYMYGCVNELYGTLTNEFQAQATDVHRDTIYFNSPDGAECYAYKLEDFKIIYNDDEVIDIGDTVYVKEFNGLFDMPFYKITKFEKANK